MLLNLADWTICKDTIYSTLTGFTNWFRQNLQCSLVMEPRHYMQQIPHAVGEHCSCRVQPSNPLIALSNHSCTLPPASLLPCTISHHSPLLSLIPHFPIILSNYLISPPSLNLFISSTTFVLFILHSYLSHSSFLFPSHSSPPTSPSSFSIYVAPFTLSPPPSSFLPTGTPSPLSQSTHSMRRTTGTTNPGERKNPMAACPAHVSSSIQSSTAA